MSKNFDFSGYATKNELKCIDGRTISKDAFKHQDGSKVPLVWQHFQETPANILGNVTLENREDGVYCYGKFNDTVSGKNAKELVRHGDIDSLSIFASQLKQQATRVIHGAIKEVSLVVAGANPGAKIDNLSFAHGDGTSSVDDEEAIIEFGLTFSHSDSETPIIEEESSTDMLNKFTEDQKEAVYNLLKHFNDGDNVVVEDTMTHAEDPTVKDIFDSFDDDQKKVVYYLISEALSESEDVEHAENTENTITNEGENIMKHNVFENTKADETGTILTREQKINILGDAKRYGTLRESFLAHADTYGFDPIDVLFPDAKAVRPGGPDTIKRDISWVEGVLSETSHTPFSRIKTRTANLTADDARAKGYVTGNKKKEEVIPLLKRVTTPTTIYKKQKLDRDDISDITDFDVVMWLKSEMRLMLNEELARAVLIGDGRTVSDEDKINPQNIRPIATDDDTVFVHRQIVPDGASVDQIIDEIIKSRTAYRGSGNPKMYTTTGLITDMLLIKDGMGRRMYSNEIELTSLLRVGKIVEVEAMNNAMMEIGGVNYDILALVVNLKDYTIGADKGGEINMFDDFDIDYNQEKYLIETRCSGALTMPKSAIVVLKKHVEG